MEYYVKPEFGRVRISPQRATNGLLHTHTCSRSGSRTLGTKYISIRFSIRLVYTDLRQTDRQTDDERQTDGQRHYSERKR